MIASFEKKLEQVKNKRKQEWKPVRNLQNEIGQLKKQASELDDFLAEMGIELTDQKNAYEKNMEEKQQKVKTHSIHGTEIIDNALNVLVANHACKKNLLGELSIFLDSKKKSSMHYDAAMVLAALSEREMKKCSSYNESLFYKEYMEKAFGVLVQQADADVYYAQWGKNIYDICLPKLVKEGDRTIAIQECKDAYRKFCKVSSAISEISLHAGYRPGDEVSEVELLFLRNQKKYTKPKDVIRNLIDTSADSNRSIIKMYRYEILEKAMMQLGNTGDSLNDLKDEISECAGTFQGDVKKLFEKYNTAHAGVIKGKNKNRVVNYMTNYTYFKVLPDEYLWVDKKRYEEDLRKTILEAVDNIKADYIVDDKWIDEIVKKYIENKKTDFYNWSKTDGQTACVENYKVQLNQKIARITVIPEYAEEYLEWRHEELSNYKWYLREYATGKAILEEIKNEAWENRWGKVPKEVVEKYYNKAEEMLKQEIKRSDAEARERSKQKASSKPRHTFTSKPQTTTQLDTMKSKGTNGLIERYKKWYEKDSYWAQGVTYIVIGFVALVCLAVAGFVVSGAGDSFIALFSSGEESSVEKTDDDLANDLINEIIRNTAELSETATPISEFSYEQVNYTGEPCIYITKYNGVAETVEVPAVIDGRNVCGIAEGAFADNIYLKKVILPDTIVSLDNRAFANCTVLEEVVCSSNLTNVYEFVFEGCSSLTSFVCDGAVSSLRTIGRGAFCGCTSLKSVDIQMEVYKSFYFGEECFKECKNLSAVNVNGEKLESVIVDKSAFNNCIVLTDVSFADKITEMYEYAFANCASLESINLSKVINIPDGAFQNCTTLTSFHVANTVKGIGWDAFNNCISLTTVTFDSVELSAEEDGYGIGHRAFLNTAITEIEIPSQYDDLGSNVFSGCPNLTKFVWHNSGKNVATQYMGDSTFYASYNVKEVYLPRTISTMYDLGCSNRGAVTVYAMEGSVPHTFATENGYTWAAWTE